MSKEKQETVVKGIKREPVSWIATHPAGHIYSVPNIDSLLAHYGKTKGQMQKDGWKFEPRYLA